MNQDKLEKYILDHRHQFDDLEPDPAVWERISTPATTPVIRLQWRKIAMQAAAVAAIFVASYFFHDYMAGRNQPASGFFSAATDEESSPFMKELIEAEAYYTSQINLRKDEVFRLTANYPDIQQEISLELVEMDKVFEDLKNDLKDNAANEEVIEAMIQNYRFKLDILEEMLYRLKQANESQNQQKNENTGLEI
jgi:hypothetical protein